MKKNAKKITAILLGILLVFAIFGIGYFTLEYKIGALKQDQITIEVPYGAGTETIADTLQKKGVIRNADLFRFTAKVMKKDTEWQYGTYKIKKGMGYQRIFSALTTPQTASIKITIPEGKQVKTIARLYQEAGICSKEDFLGALDKNLYSFDFLKAITTRNDLEGYLFPDTYYFEPNTDAKIVIETMLSRFEEKLYTEEYRNRCQSLGYSFDQMLTLASVVESEARLESDRKTIAGVFFNRLNNGGKLQSCVTVEYAMGIKKNIISAKDTKFDSPYNTYLYAGLPIGPICCPSEMSFRATLWPKETNYYYFQSDAKGIIHFAETYEEHVAVQKDVQKDWAVTDDYEENKDTTTSP